MTHNRIDRRFAALAAEGRAGFVAYLMAGDPDRATSLDLLRGLPAAGADIIDLGMGNPDLATPPHVIEKLKEPWASRAPTAIRRRAACPRSP